MAVYLAFKEVWRNRGRFFLFSMVIALITTLVLFIAALAQGLALANKEYLSKLDAELVVFQENVDLSVSASRISRSTLKSIRRVDGVQAAGGIGLSSGALVLPGLPNDNVSLVGIEPGQPGEPVVLSGRGLGAIRANEAIIDGALAAEYGLQPGDTLNIKTIQGTQEKLYQVQVVGVTSGQQFLFAPSVFLPYGAWDRIRPQPASAQAGEDVISNIVAVKVSDPAQQAAVANRIAALVEGIEVADPVTAYQNLPGYAAQQSTLNTQQAFTLLIGVLVVGGFFQIQLLQKIPQIGVLKAIGTSNSIVAAAVVMQIVMVSTFGVLMGGIVTAGLALGLPGSVPIQFVGSSIALAVGLLLVIGPLGGLVSVLRAVTVEPLLALGLQS